MHLLDCYNLCYLLPNMTAYHSDYIMILCCSLNGLFFKCQTSPASNMMWFNNKYTTTTCELADHAWSSGHKMVGNSVTLSATSWACLLAQRLMLQPLSMPSIAPLHHGLILRWRPESQRTSLPLINILIYTDTQRGLTGYRVTIFRGTKRKLSFLPALSGFSRSEDGEHFLQKDS